MRSSSDTRIPMHDCIGVAAIAYATLQFEVLASRILSALVLKHYAYVVIALAMLGWTIGGLFAARTETHAPRAASFRTRGALCIVIGIIVAIGAFIALAGLTVGIQQLVAASPITWMVLGTAIAIAVGAVAIPFAFGGAVIAHATARYAARAGTLYAVDLAGAAAGALGAALLLPALGAIGALATTAAIALVGAIAFARGSVQFPRYGVVACVLLLLGIVVGDAFRPLIAWRTSAPIEYAAWNTISYVTVHESGPRTDPSYTFSWRKNDAVLPTPEKLIKIDRDAEAPLVPVRGDHTTVPFIAESLAAAPYAVRQGDVLIIGAGGGADVLAALQFPGNRVTAVEVNPIIARLTRERYASFIGNIFDDPRVSLVVAEGRDVLRHGDRAYDVIMTSMVDTWAASAQGTLATVENYLYTTEAIHDALARLTTNGILTFIRWDHESDAFTTLLARVIGSEHLATRVRMLRHQKMVAFLVHAHAWNADDDRALTAFADANGYTIDATFPPITPTDIARAATDDRPFFFQQIAPLSLTSIRANTRVATQVLVITFWVIVAAVIGLTAVAWRRMGVRHGQRYTPSVAYAFAIGIAFFLAEVVLIQRLVLFIGQPMVTLAVLLTGFLCCAAAGSAIADRLPLRVRSILLLACAPIFLFLVDTVVIPALLTLSMFPIWTRAMIAVVVIAPPSITMGMFFPLFLRWVRSRAPEHIPALWVINSAGSALGSISALVLGLMLGFHATIRIAAWCYIIAAGFLLYAIRRQSSDDRHQSSEVVTGA